jgi:isoleucyl-tRNA synthetase
VLAILKDVFLPWYNAYRFLLQNVDTYEREEKTVFSWNEVRELPYKVT